ncbi:alpha/beta fold hydrolase [Dyadobacter sp. NIV53]|uniref:alpha/beta fold hydrolase n=1 Tax=Dyadobacter sp. NIV53 TaxID=2861765 RepID=UPI001C88024C|nr:alpha/beta fold hydrolase [Dyadobacter sp. NIV53]
MNYSIKRAKSIRSLLAALALATFSTLALASCTEDHENPEAAQRKTYVLVNGAFQAAYGWDKVKAALESKGNQVVVVELPGHGTDQTIPSGITMDSYRDKVVASIQPLQGKVILVGHSLGGIIISAAAEVLPDKIERLIYLGAFVPKDGESLFSIASEDSESELSPLFVPSGDHLTIGISDFDKLQEVFCADASPEDKKVLLEKFRQEPAIPLTNPVTLTSAKFGTVSKSYIKTLQDRALGKTLQNKMITENGIADVREIASSHCPHLSKAQELSTLLISIANQK